MRHDLMLYTLLKLAEPQRQCVHGVPLVKDCAQCRGDLQPVGRRGQIVDLDTHRNGFVYDPE